MKLAHLDAFRPVCPRCRTDGRGEQPLRLGPVARGDDAEIVDGMLACPLPACQAEYPILDGIPVLVPDVRAHVSSQLAEWRAGEASPWVDSVLGDCAPPDGELARNRLYLSSYGQAHWGAGAHPPGLPPVLDAVFDLIGAPRGRCVDLGCATGRGAVELAARGADLVVGVDLNVALVRAARRMLRDGRLVVPVRRVGQVFDPREVALDPRLADAAARVDVWCADATSLPLPAASVDVALSLNVLDSVGWPLLHLLELARVLADDAVAALATPYDWNVAVTPIEGWLGGHSQRGPLAGSSVAELRRILAPADRPGGAPDLAIDAERDGIPWTLRIHERASMTYDLHLMRVRPDRART